MARLTFLEAVQRAYRESGIGGSTGPVTVLSQTGRNADFVKWVQTAFEDIQNLRDQWNFAWARGTFTLTSGTDSYDPVVDFGITLGVAEWVREGAYVYRPASGLSSRLWLSYLEWERFRDLPIPPVPGFPNVFSVQPDGLVRYYPKPEQTYTAVHEYFRNPQVLAADGDVPRLPDRFHMAIVWKAVMHYATFNKDWSLHDSAEEKYEKVMDGVFEKEQGKWTSAGAMV